MTKQQTIELLQKQLPAFYSLEQVISIINDIEEPASTPSVSITAEQFENFIEIAEEKIESMIARADSEDLVDYSSAEMEMNSNEVSLVSVEVNSHEIVSQCISAVREAVTDYFTVGEDWS